MSGSLQEEGSSEQVSRFTHTHAHRAVNTLLYTSTLLYFRGKYCTFYSTAFIWQFYLLFFQVKILHTNTDEKLIKYIV